MATRDNKLARSARQRQTQRNAKSAENEPNVSDILARLEDDIRRLKIEFDVYFNGGSKRPPYDTKNRVETVIKRLGDDRTLNFAQRYHYNTLATRYNSLHQLWRRTLQAREEGREPIPPPRVAARIGPIDSSPRQTFSCADPNIDISTVKNLFKALKEAREKCGESVEEMSFPRFHHLITKKTESLKERLGCDRVKFSVYVEDGHVAFKAKADKDKGDHE